MKLRALILLSAALACAGDSSAPADQPHLAVTFQRTPLSNNVVPDSAAIAPAGGTIDVAGKIMAGDPCRVIKGDLVVLGDRVQLTMRTDADGSAGCVTVVARFGYNAVITGVAHGTWTVDVRHLEGGTGGATLVASQTVVIE